MLIACYSYPHFLFLRMLRALGEYIYRLGCFIRSAATMDLTIVSFACFILATEIEEARLFLPFRLQGVRHDGRNCAKEVVFVQLRCDRSTKSFKHGLLCIFSNCRVGLVAANLIFARAAELYWMVFT